MSRKKIIISTVVLVVLIGGIYAWSEYTRTVKSLAGVEADFTTDAAALIAEFEKDELAADKKYHNKIVAVNGMVKGVDAVQNTYSIVLGDTSQLSAVRCVVDSVYVKSVSGVNRGMVITVKGAITGFKKDDTGLLGSDVELNRCVIE
jgi:tRNA_anti-like